jgi:tyrosine-protein kinase Etk/Wzc
MTQNAPEKTLGTQLLESLTILMKYRKGFVRFVIGATVLTLIVTLLLPKWYKSTASVFPAEKTEMLSGLEGVSSLVRNFSAGRALSSLAGNDEADRYIAILKSSTVLAAVIDKFGLVELYDYADSPYKMDKTVKELLSNAEFAVEDEGNLTISVLDKDPQRAADMANYFVDMLNRTNTELQVQNARGNRKFIEERYQKNMVDLALAEDSLKAFQQRFGVISMPEQTEASIKAAAEIAGQLALKEVQVGILRRTQSADNPSVAAAQIETEELRSKLAELGGDKGVSAGGMRVLVPFSKVPELGGEYVRHFRDVEIQYKILQFITPMYEQAKVEERRQTPSVLVLDRAMPAERKARPKVILFTLLAFVVSILLAFAGIILRETFDRMRIARPAETEALISAVRSDWFGLRLFGKRR